MVEAWHSAAKAGVVADTRWQPFTNASRSTLLLDTVLAGGIRAVSNLHRAACNWWDQHIDIAPVNALARSRRRRPASGARVVPS